MIGDQRRLRRNNENAKLIAEEAVLKVRETNKVQELYRIANEIPETKKMKELRIRQEVEKEWGEWKNVLSADEVDPLVGLRFKFGKIRQLPREASEKILENEMPGMRKEIPKKETYNKYGDAARKIEIEAIGKTWHFCPNSFCENS